jgi:hypothetical protein
MIVFRDQRAAVDPAQLLSTIRIAARRLAGQASPDHEEAIQLLISAGSLEAALVDRIFPSADGTTAMSRRLREAVCALGRAVWHTWGDHPAEARRWLEQSAATLAFLQLQQLPSTVELSVPEGYAYYAVYPEMYLEAARRFHHIHTPRSAVCLGLRSIGTSLSAVVAGALEELGCAVASFTLRPRGHPFDRRPVVTSELAEMLQREREATFLLIDEGPGISGSSLASTAELLSHLGISDDRIVLFPSWATDGSGLKSQQARDRWSRHTQFVVDFDEVWVSSGRLTQALPPGKLREFSAGAWRNELCAGPEEFPAVQPQHERRKYLYQVGDPAESAGEFSWLSFLGLVPDSATSQLRRAQQLAAAGFTAAPTSVTHGFLVTPFTPGSPLRVPGEMDAALLEILASYLAHISCTQSAQPSVTHTALLDMVVTNTVEGLGDEWASRLHPRLRKYGDSWCERTVALDGRMLPHEWIRTSNGYLKTDAVHHHDDHFFPGCQDIAWDVAGACLEFNLGPRERQQLIERYRSLSGDSTITARLPLHALTYLAFRLGYTTLSASTLSGGSDGKRFSEATHRYSELLRLELSHTASELWNA